MEAGWLAAAVVVPLYFNIYSSRVFEPDKLIALRCIVLVMALAFFVRLFEGGRYSPVADNLGNRLGSIWREFRADNPLAIPTLAFCVILVVSTVASVSPGVSLWGSYQRLQGTYTSLTYVALFFLVAHGLRTKAQLDRLITVIILTTLPISLYGIAQHEKMDPLPWAGDVTSRVVGTMGNAIFLAAYLIMVAPLTVARLVDAIARLRSQELPRAPAGLRLIGTLVALLIVQNAFLLVLVAAAANNQNLWYGALGAAAVFLNVSILFHAPRPTRVTVWAEIVAYLALLLVQLATIVLTQSRGPMLGLGASLLVFALLLAARNRSTRLLKGSCAVGGFLIFLVISFNIPGSPLAEFKDVPYVGRLGSIFETEGGTGKVRLLIWQGSWNLFVDHPSAGLQPDPLNVLRPVIGYGPETMYVVFNKVYPPDLAHYEARNATPDRSHMAILDLLVTTGVAGLSAFLFVVVVALRAAWRSMWRAKQHHYQLIAASIISAISAHLVESQFGIPIASTLTYLWLFFGVIVAITVMQRDEIAAGEGAFVKYRDAADAVDSDLAVSKVSQMGEVESQAKSRSVNARDKAKTKSKVPVSQPATLARQRAASGHALTLRLVRARSLESTAVDWRVAGLFVLLSAMTLFLLTRLDDVAGNVQQAYIAGFLWLVVGIVAVATSIGGHLGLKDWRFRHWWSHVPALLLAGLAIVLNLNVVAADTYYKRGFVFESQRQLLASAQAYQDALKLAPNQDFYYLFLGRIFLELSKANSHPGSTFPGKIDLDFVRLVQPGDIQRLGRDDLLEASRIALEEALRLAPLNPDHTANLARLYRTWAVTDKTKLALAIQYYADAVRIAPQAAHLWDEWAEVYLYAGQPEKAIEKLEIARKLDEEFPLTFLYLGDAYIALNRPSDAFDAHARVLALDPGMLSDQRLEYRVDFYLEKKMADRLVPLYVAAVNKYTESAAVRSGFGYLLSRLGRMTEASKEFESWVKLSPGDWIARRNLALSYEALGELDLAVREAEESQNLAPADQKEALARWIADLKRRKQ